MDDLTGKMLGPFHIEGRLGKGAMGTVYRGQHSKTKKEVAVKVMATFDEEVQAIILARFEREIKLLSQFRHANIVRIFGAAEHQGIRYYAMELVEGKSLEQILRDQRKLPFRHVIAYGIQICEALQEIHTHGIVHRDLKPANIMVAENNVVKLTDFGIAKDVTNHNATQLTRADQTVGTIAYMSPEQLGGKDITPKSDIYSLGIMLYRMLTDRLPFTGDTMFEYMDQRMAGAFPRPTAVDKDIPLEFDELIGDMLHQDPSQRPRDAYMVMQRLLDIRQKAKAGTLAKMRSKTNEKPTVDPEIAKASQTKTGIGSILNTLIRTRTKTVATKKGSADSPTGLTDSPWFWGLLLLACLSLGGWLMLPTSPESQFRKGMKIMESADNAIDMQAAFTRYFEPLLQKHPNSPFAERIAKERVKLDREQARGIANQALRFNKRRDNATPAETQYIDALEFKKKGDDAVAAERLQAIVFVFATNPQEAGWVALAKERLEKDFANQASTNQTEQKIDSVSKSLININDLVMQNQRAAAIVQYKSLEKLYGDDPEVAFQISEAAAGLLGPDELFERGKKLIDSDDPGKWERAVDHYFNPIEKEYPNSKHSPAIQAGRDKLALHRADQKLQHLLLAPGLPRKAPSPAEGLCLWAALQQRLGDAVNAEATLRTVIAGFVGNDAERPWVRWAERRQNKEIDPSPAKKKTAARVALAKLLTPESNADFGPYRQLLISHYRQDQDLSALVDEVVGAAKDGGADAGK